MFGMIGGKILVVSPHYDDEIIGCGGILLLFREKIERLTVAHVTKCQEERRLEFENVRRKLNIDEDYSLDCEDGFCSDNSREATLALIRIIQLEKPDMILAPHEKEAHTDHQAVSKIALDAAQKARFWELPDALAPHEVPTFLEYEVWTPISEPSIFYDITPVFDTKCSLIREYKSQLASFPYVDYIRAFNTWRGILHNCYGQVEAFRLRCL